MTNPVFSSESHLKKLSLDLSRDRLLVQGAGGNISAKEGDIIWIKASGTWLSEAGSKNIFLPISLGEIAKLASAGKFDRLPNPLGESSLRPSIETWLHALMPQKYVVHLHAIEILALLVHQDSQNEITKLDFGDVAWEFIPYTKPGAELAQAVSEKLKSKSIPDVLFLENHGIVVGANSISEVLELIAHVRNICSQPIKQGTEISRTIRAQIGKYLPVRDDLIHSLATQPNLMKLVATAWAIAPDHIVFLGAKPVFCDELNELLELEKKQDPPLVAFVRNVGVYSLNELDESGAQQLQAFFEILRRQTNEQEFAIFTDSQIAELLDWDAEKYRLSLRK